MNRQVVLNTLSGLQTSRLSAQVGITAVFYM